MNTDWSDYLEHEAGGQIDDTHSLIAFESAENELTALANGAVAVPLLHLGILRCSGEDASVFLHNLLSNNVEKLPTERAQWTSLNTPKGRMLSNFLLWSEQNDYLLVLPQDLCATTLKKLSMYVLRSKVRLTDAGNDLALIGVAGPKAAAYLQTAGMTLPAPGALSAISGDTTQIIRIDDDAFIIVTQSGMAAATYRRLPAAGCTQAGTNAWRLAMIRRGLPLLSVPTQEAFVAQMLNFEVIGGIRTGKGCYPGQEIITRIRSQGKIKQRMYRVAFTSKERPEAGTELFSPGLSDQSTGTIVNAAAAGNAGDDHFEALAVIRISSAEADNVRLGSLDGPRLSFLDLPYVFDVE